MILRTMPWKLAASRISAAATSAKAIVHNEFSSTLPRKLVEITAYHEQISASAISGRISFAIFLAVSEWATQFAQNDDPLNGETKLRQCCDRSAHQNARKPGIEQANSLDIGTRQERTEGTAENIDGAE